MQQKRKVLARVLLLALTMLDQSRTLAAEVRGTAPSLQPDGGRAGGRHEPSVLQCLAWLFSAP